MAEWLEEQEGKQLLLDFKAEMDRLEAPTEQVAPNWRQMWGLAALMRCSVPYGKSPGLTWSHQDELMSIP